MIIKTIGRGLKNDIVVNDPYVTKEIHCQIISDDKGTFRLIDSSRNGTIVNGRKIHHGEIKLQCNDIVKVGHTLLAWQEYFSVSSDKPLPLENPSGIRDDDSKKELEEKLARLEKELAEMKQKFPVYDPGTDYGQKYEALEQELNEWIARLEKATDSFDFSYVPTFPFHPQKFAYYHKEYEMTARMLCGVINQIATKTNDAQMIYENDLSLLENMTRQFASPEQLQRIFSIKEDIKKHFKSIRNRVVEQMGVCLDRFETYYSRCFDSFAQPLNIENANRDYNDGKCMPDGLLRGDITTEHEIFGETICFEWKHFIEILNHKHLEVCYNRASKQRSLDFANALIGNLLASVKSGEVIVTMIDTEEMDGTCSVFKQLNRKIFNILVRPDDIRKCLDGLEQRMENIIRDLLHDSVNSLFDYNLAKENKEPYHLLVIKDFPQGIYQESLYLLKSLLKNGIRAGIHVLLLVNEDEINRSEEHKRIFHGMDWEAVNKLCDTYDFVRGNYFIQEKGKAEDIHVDTLSEKQLYEIVQKINTNLEIKKEEILPVADYLLPQSEWWDKSSASFIEIPFGISKHRRIQTLKITQESGQNSVVVVGIPGSGKSVFLHSVICNAAMKYSPDELEMYLMDFSGVEFNTYAEHNLPHAKVIAPEAEREFGLSILNKLKEEGERRMNLCRELSTSQEQIRNIVELKGKHPEVYCPRILVVIDEFQKLFEYENDNISRQAHVIIHIIIKEFRKFGINLILATQKLSDISNSILPRDLIANRVVFKCSPMDVALIGESVMPRLTTGECIYNSESGIKEANHKIQTFFMDNESMNKILTDLKTFALTRAIVSKETLVFRSSDLPDFRNRRPVTKPSLSPLEVTVHFGQPISISDTDVCANIMQISNDNILIIGGESSVAESIAYFAANSVTTQYEDLEAEFYFFNFMRPDNPLNDCFEAFKCEGVLNSVFVSKQDEVLSVLQEIKEKIDLRMQDDTCQQRHVWLFIYAFQLAQMFKMSGRRGDSVSECGQLLRFILANGPLVGIFTILQVDNEPNLRQLDNVIGCFEHRVVLQMDENGSNRIIGSDMASKLYVINRASSVFRGYYYNNKNRILNKFKPYCIKMGNVTIPSLRNKYVI